MGCQARLDLSGSSQLTISGTTEILYGNLSGGSRPDVTGWLLVSRHRCFRRLAGKGRYPNGWMRDASGGSRIFYRGNPQCKILLSNGGGRDPGLKGKRV